MTVERLAVIEPPARRTLYIPRGWIGSGKSTLFEQMRAVNPRLVRVSRDDLRATLFSETGRLTFAQEQTITKVEKAQAAALLDADYDVFADAMNLRKRWAQGWADFATLHGADFEVIDLDTPVDECVRRDAARGAAGGRSVGEAAIREIAHRFPRKTWPKIEPSPDLWFYPEPYVPDESLPPAWIVDVDNTIAEHAGRDPYDYSRVHEDKPIQHTVEIVRKLAVDSAIIVLSGRDDACQSETEEWMRVHEIPFTELHMRTTGDGRPDFRAKFDLFNEFVRPRFRILGALDDRLQVCRLWYRLGVPLLRQGDPDATW